MLHSLPVCLVRLLGWAVSRRSKGVQLVSCSSVERGAVVRVQCANNNNNNSNNSQVIVCAGLEGEIKKLCSRNCVFN